MRKQLIKYPWFRLSGILLLGLMTACSLHGNKKNKVKKTLSEYAEGTYGYDVGFFAANGIETVELKDETGNACLLLAPIYQGRVLTSTARGPGGTSFGWINYDLIRSGQVRRQFNPVGGEERFWLGPEGGPYSLYFKQGQEQVFSNWVVPAVIDTERFDISDEGSRKVSFSRHTTLRNASGTRFILNIKRTVNLLSMKDISSFLGIEIPSTLEGVAYQTENVIRNAGKNAWTKEGGLLSIWMLCMFNPTESTTVFIPYKKNAEGLIINDDYFGKVPTDRLIIEEGTIFFRTDGKHRSKIGIPYPRARELCGSYDSGKKVLTLLWFNLPAESGPYVNSKWGDQENSYNGDVINSYNDGPVEDGSIMGPFYEIETSSPGAELMPGESLIHIQRIMHFQGDEASLDKIVNGLFNLELKDIKSKFH